MRICDPFSKPYIDLQINQNDLKTTIDSHREDALHALVECKNIDKIAKALIEFENDYKSLQDQVLITENNIDNWYQKKTMINLIIYPLLVQGLIEILEDSNISINHHIYEELDESMDSKTELLNDLLDELGNWKANNFTSKISNYEFKVTNMIEDFKTFDHYAKICNKLENEKLKLLNQNESSNLIGDIITKKIFNCHDYALNQTTIY